MSIDDIKKLAEAVEEYGGYNRLLSERDEARAEVERLRHGASR